MAVNRGVRDGTENHVIYPQYLTVLRKTQRVVFASSPNNPIIVSVALPSRPPQALRWTSFGDGLLALRDDDLHADQYCARRIRLLGDGPYMRNEEALHAVSGGMMKILFPHG